jgi:hypothetical protein
MIVQVEQKCICGQHGRFQHLIGGRLECPSCLRRYHVSSRGYLVRIFREVAVRGKRAMR